MEDSRCSYETISSTCVEVIWGIDVYTWYYILGIIYSVMYLYYIYVLYTCIIYMHYILVISEVAKAIRIKRI